MKAMILAAGLGQRMRPLTDALPKPLLTVGGKPLLQYHLEALQRAGIREVVINLAYLGEKIRDFVGDGSRFDIEVTYSPEPEPLETGGGLLQALPLLGTDPFLVINGDVWSDYALAPLIARGLGAGIDGHLVLVPNPAFHVRGDFAFATDDFLTDDAAAPERFTFAGISMLNPALIAQYPERRTKFPLAEVLRWAMAGQRITGEVFRGNWSDVGTPERLAALAEFLDNSNQVSILKS